MFLINGGHNSLQFIWVLLAESLNLSAATATIICEPNLKVARRAGQSIKEIWQR